jgi:hypothetical protein
MKGEERIGITKNEDDPLSYFDNIILKGLTYRSEENKKNTKKRTKERIKNGRTLKLF